MNFIIVDQKLNILDHGEATTQSRYGKLESRFGVCNADLWNLKKEIERHFNEEVNIPLGEERHERGG